METIFNQKTVDGLTDRINQLKTTNNAQWGKMNAYQMLKHCTLSEEMFQGKRQYKRLFMGKLFGRMALNGILKDDKPMKKNQPTHPEFKIKGNGNFETEKAKWIDLLNGYNGFSNTNFVHPFFGKMTKEEIGKYIFKHTDHHLRQFGK
ncbi:DUF1569 domain-containing protein [Cyclobacterium marinum]|uniref:DUF1569 domain-containing protein n=1 Tax=Cyclobacterium marinum (strain ATCC 25205 / DSM 745 / LMG 13164 / NCIMB 1802) TaxID=880070 RepID=G0J3Q1_CYCMS|nr:DUF1569 domain-containing protein [Cyclobacterium marinum]AEL25257.1 hypothetical protein Cycma_1493 [Cyclobacterium marinum DSM 745]MBR9777947.1 DUF1569 domain-containing protein [Cytophagales bacterium]|tara:strand:+ start:4246 stop:4689 length:444 start_codon:yes stop_codon:yes gene_type:complete